MSEGEHPAPDLLLRFLQGEASKSENRAVVRHLLTGCRSCALALRPLWPAADEPVSGDLHMVREGRG